MSQNPAAFKAAESAKKAYKKKKKEVDSTRIQPTAGPYIPGLTPAPEGLNDLQVSKSQDPTIKDPKEINEELIGEFLSGKKHPVSSIMEYGASLRLDIKFREVGAVQTAYSTKYACQCSVDGVEYESGLGRNKKEAKTEAAKLALTKLLGIEQDDIANEEEASTIITDSFGRKTKIATTIEPSLTATKPPEFVALSTYEEPSAYSIIDGTIENAIQELSNFCLDHKLIHELNTSDIPGPFGFETKILVKDELVAKSSAPSKIESKKKAASEALLLLERKYQSYGGTVPGMSTADKIANMCNQHLYKLMEQFPEFGVVRKTVAAFVVKRSENDDGQVVAIGVGNRTIAGEHLVPNGRVITDSNALTLARRSLIRYFQREMKLYHEGSIVVSIFTECDNPFRMRLKDHITIHLYISGPLPGDYYRHADSPSNKFTADEQRMVDSGGHIPCFVDGTEQGFLTTTNEDGLISTVDPAQISPQSIDQINEGEDYLVMSASDKLLQWNIVGLQGAIYSNITDPIYVSSITVGQGFDHGHLSRTSCCRVYDILTESLPPNYYINHPKLQKTDLLINQLFPNGSTYSALAMNWAQGDDMIEVINGCTGLEDPGSPFKSGRALASRVCKAAFLAKYRELVKIVKNIKLLQAQTYFEAKNTAVLYQKAKAAFRAHCLEAQIGHWVLKPIQIDQFGK